MEVLFENSYIRNKELAKEVYRYYYFQRPILVFMHVMLALSFFLNVIMLIIEKTYEWTVLLFVPLIFAFYIFLYFRQVSAMVKRDNEVHGKEISVKTIVTDDYIQNIFSTGANSKLEYSKISKAAQTKNLILLRSKANLIYIFRKDTFVGGSKEEFIAFLRNKGIKIK